jgi:hypothetical protein
MQRREFVVATGSLLVTGLPQAAPLATPVAAPLARATLIAPPHGLKTLGSDSFTPLVNQDFLLYQNRQGVKAQLTAVNKLTAASGDQFTLTFTTPAGVVLASGTYDVENAAVGLVPMYLEQAPQNQLLAHFNLKA